MSESLLLGQTRRHVERAAVRVGLDWNEEEAEIRLFLFVFSEIISVGDPTTWPADCLSSVVYGINVGLKGAAEILKLVDGPGDVELPEVIIHIQQ